MLSASSTACLIEATVESMLTMTPFFRPRDGWVPTPMMSRPSGPISPTTQAILVVPMSRPTMMSEDLRGMRGQSSPRLSATRNFLLIGRAGAVGETDHEPQSGPGVVDGAHLVIDEASGESTCADLVFVQVGGEAARLLGPGDPETAGRIEARRQCRQVARQLSRAVSEADDHVKLTLATGDGARGDVVGEIAQRLDEVVGGADQPEPRAGLDPELLRQRRSRVTGHRLGSVR